MTLIHSPQYHDQQSSHPNKSTQSYNGHDSQGTPATTSHAPVLPCARSSYQDMSFDEISAATDERQHFRHRLICVIPCVWHELNDPDADRYETIALAFRQEPRSKFEENITAEKLEEEMYRLKTCLEADKSCYEVYDFWTEGIRCRDDWRGLLIGIKSGYLIL